MTLRFRVKVAKRSIECSTPEDAVGLVRAAHSRPPATPPSSAAQSRFMREWSKYACESGWDADTRDRHFTDMRDDHKRGQTSDIRADMALRLRSPENGMILSYPEIAKLIGYNTHTAAIAAVRRRGLPKTKVTITIPVAGRDAGLE